VLTATDNDFGWQQRLLLKWGQITRWPKHCLFTLKQQGISLVHADNSKNFGRVVWKGFFWVKKSK